LRSLRKSFELRFGQKTVTTLDSAKVVEDHGACLKWVTPRCTQRTARCGVDESSGYYLAGRRL
jgi:hypothetical protein